MIWKVTMKIAYMSKEIDKCNEQFDNEMEERI